MSTISLRLPNYLHDTLRELARKEGISINQLAMLALAEKASVLMTEEILIKRAQRGSRMKFEQALSKIADSEPAEEDRLKNQS
jgi:hypothetical protein